MAIWLAAIESTLRRVLKCLMHVMVGADAGYMLRFPHLLPHQSVCAHANAAAFEHALYTYVCHCAPICQDCGQVRNLRKKLQQIEALEARQQDSQLDPQQQAKLAQKAEVCDVLEALHSGATLEEAHKIALSHKPSLHLTAPVSSIHRSSSTLSVDSSGSKSRSSKHRPAASRLSSRQNLSQPALQAPAADSSAPEQVHSSSPQQPTQSGAESSPPCLDSQLRTLAQACTPAASASASGSRTSAWGHANSSPVASLRVSGFGTPQGQKAEAPVWATPSTVSPLNFASTGSLTTHSAAPSAAAKKAKPPRKGGLSMFLSGAAFAPGPACLSRSKSASQGSIKPLMRHGRIAALLLYLLLPGLML